MLLSLHTAVSRTALAATLGLTTLAVAAPANAGRHNPAPIVYADEVGNTQMGQGTQTARQPASTSTQTASATPGRRVEFRYPDQPGTVYSQAGARPAETNAPIAFSSSTAAITVDAARQYAHLEAPAAARAPVAIDPAITSGGFDARATAARIAAQSELPAPQELAAVAPAPQSTQPTLSEATYSLPGTVHQPAQVEAYEQSGLAGLYDDAYQGQPTANGEAFDQAAMTAAHPTLPLPSLVQVINEDTGQEVVVRVNDRGPFEDGRMIDVSRKAGELLGMNAGGANVRVRYLGPAPVAAPTAAPLDLPPPARVVTLGDLPEMVAPAPMPVSTRAPAPAAYGDYFVQLGSFSDISNAQRMSRSLDATLNVDIVTARVNNADYFRVWVGPFPDRSAADRTRGDLARRGVADGMVVSGS